jgi:hypothetical protein
MKAWPCFALACICFLFSTGKSVQADESAAPSGGLSGFFGSSNLSNPNISLILDTRVYTSNLSNSELAAKGIPGYTLEGLEMKKGFNLDSAELAFFSSVDPYFNLYANIPITVEGVQLEEAYVVSTALPSGWQLKLGRFKSNITRLDAMHPHAWDFTDIALPYRAFVGTEGLGGENGAQVTYLLPLPIYVLAGAEALQGENSLILNGEAWQGPQAYTGFIKTSIDTSDLSTLYFGPWVLAGQTKTDQVIAGETLTGQSTLTGLEAVWKWKPYAGIGLTVQSEYMYLHQEGDLANAAISLGGLQRNQDGFYIQSVYQWHQYRMGARYDRLALVSDQFEIDHEQQDLGEIPWRATASCEYDPDEFTNIRLQYTYDASARTGQINREVMLQFIYAIGAHPAHTF